MAAQAVSDRERRCGPMWPSASASIASSSRRRFSRHHPRRPPSLEGPQRGPQLLRKDFAKLAASARRPVDASAVAISSGGSCRSANCSVDVAGANAGASAAICSALGRCFARPTQGHFTDEEILRLHQPRVGHAGDVVWHFNMCLSSMRHGLCSGIARKATKTRRTYGHICIDEAQDLAPMELRDRSSFAQRVDDRRG